MQSSKSMRVRPLQVTDFAFIRRLASKHNNFTVPPPYVLWLLRRTNPRSCMVVEHAKIGPIAYLLSILVCEPPQKVLYVWQLAASKQGLDIGAIDRVLLELRAFVRRTRVQKLLFTVDPRSPEYRAIRRYAYTLFGKRVELAQFLPRSVSRSKEHEYLIDLT